MEIDGLNDNAKGWRTEEMLKSSNTAKIRLKNVKVFNRSYKSYLSGYKLLTQFKDFELLTERRLCWNDGMQRTLFMDKEKLRVGISIHIISTSLP